MNDCVIHMYVQILLSKYNLTFIQGVCIAGKASFYSFSIGLNFPHFPSPFGFRYAFLINWLLVDFTASNNRTPLMKNCSEEIDFSFYLIYLCTIEKVGEKKNDFVGKLIKHFSASFFI